MEEVEGQWRLPGERLSLYGLYGAESVRLRTENGRRESRNLYPVPDVPTENNPRP